MAEQHEKALVPQIRFAGFADPWEQRKLSSTCEQLSRTINPLETPNEEFTEYSMPAFDNNETAETVIGNSMNSLRKIVDRPCLLVNKLNVRKKRIWHVPRPEANAVCSSEFVPFSSHSSDLSFIKISLLSERITAYLESCSSGSSNSQKRVTPEIIMSSEIIAPSLAEQRRIGAFFDRLDSLITLHQRKYDKLCVLKKSMLDKMFPKGGSLYPEIRFAGFTDPWEQRKLEDYVVVSTAKNVDGRFNKEDVLSVSGEYGIVNQIAFQGRSFAGSSVLNYGIVNTGDIVYTKSPLNSNPYGIIKVNKGIPGIVSTLYAVYRPQDNVHTNFIQVYFEQHERMNNYMHPLVNKGAKNDMKVTAENALKGVVTFPSREEQVIISEFFDRLDSLITLHQRKLELLRNIKKSMLDKMFV